MTPNRILIEDATRENQLFTTTLLDRGQKAGWQKSKTDQIKLAGKHAPCSVRQINGSSIGLRTSTKSRPVGRIEPPRVASKTLPRLSVPRSIRYTPVMNKRLTRISKYLSFVLKHHPESIGLELDSERWSNLEELVTKANASGKTLAASQIHQIIVQSDEIRFELSEDQLKIRAL